MLLLVGLGNPGPKYERNRHNIGFMAVDRIVRRHSFQQDRARFQSICAEGVIGGRKTLIMKPTTFMNESGRAVGEAVRFFKLAPAQVVVLHDELDLVLGKVRAKCGGGHAGHNGLRSITQHIGPDFWRIRIGIGHPGEKEKVHGHVLSDFAKADEPMVARIVDAICDAAPLIAKEDFNGFMTRAALLINPPKPKPAPAPETNEKNEKKDGI
jgi:peptidyl-tRNA hydrolase, PTH1 family